MTTAIEPTPAPTHDVFVPDLSLDLIDKSSTNPRKRITDAEIDELADSIRTHGVVQAILVRPHRQIKGWYELVFGERRFRGSVRAGKSTIPAIVRELTDEQVLEIQIIENLQRKDVHPLEEGQGYQALIDTLGYDVKQVAERISKSKEYVYKRLKLAGAIPELQELFFDEKSGVTSNHVEQIARLPEVSQRVVLEKGLFRRVRTEEKSEIVPLTLAEVLVDGPAVAREKQIEREAVSTRELDKFIHEHIYTDLDQHAIFNQDDPRLFPEAGTCAACDKRFGRMCADRACFHRKTNAHVGDALRATMESQRMGNGVLLWSHHAPWPVGSCPHLQNLICIDGTRKGEKKLVCVTDSCPIHNPKPQPDDTAVRDRQSAIKKEFTPQADRVEKEGKSAPMARSLKDEFRQAQKDAADPIDDHFDKEGWLRELGESRDFIEATIDRIEHGQVLLARGSADAAFARLERLRGAINSVVENMRAERHIHGTSQTKAPPKQQDLPSTMAAAVPYYAKLIRKYHAAVLDSDRLTVDALENEAHALATKLNGGNVGILADSRKPGYVLPPRTKTAKGAIPLWGQQGNFILKIRDIPIRIEVEGIFGVAFGGFAAHAVDFNKPFITETGYRNFLGNGAPAGRTVDQFVRDVITSYIDAPRKPKRSSEEQGLGGKLVDIQPQYRKKKSPKRTAVTGRPGKSVSRPQREHLVTCSKCGVENFTPNGISRHRLNCKGKVIASKAKKRWQELSARTKAKKRGRR